MGRKSGQAHFPNFETQSGRICRQHIRLFFEVPYHFYIPPLPDFPFLPERQFLFYRHMFRFISCSASHTVLITGIDFLRESTGRSEPAGTALLTGYGFDGSLPQIKDFGFP